MSAEHYERCRKQLSKMLPARRGYYIRWLAESQLLTDGEFRKLVKLEDEMSKAERFLRGGRNDA